MFQYPESVRGVTGTYPRAWFVASNVLFAAGVWIVLMLTGHSKVESAVVAVIALFLANPRALGMLAAVAIVRVRARMQRRRHP